MIRYAVYDIQYYADLDLDVLCRMTRISAEQSGVGGRTWLHGHDHWKTWRNEIPNPVVIHSHCKFLQILWSDNIENIESIMTNNMLYEITSRLLTH